MTPRNDTPALPRPNLAQPAPTPAASRPPLSTPLVWAGGGVLLTGTMWLGSMVALFRAFGSLFH